MEGKIPPSDQASGNGQLGTGISATSGISWTSQPSVQTQASNLAILALLDQLSVEQLQNFSQNLAEVPASLGTALQQIGALPIVPSSLVGSNINFQNTDATTIDLLTPVSIDSQIKALNQLINDVLTNNQISPDLLNQLISSFSSKKKKIKNRLFQQLIDALHRAKIVCFELCDPSGVRRFFIIYNGVRIVFFQNRFEGNWRSAHFEKLIHDQLEQVTSERTKIDKDGVSVDHDALSESSMISGQSSTFSQASMPDQTFAYIPDLLCQEFENICFDSQIDILLILLSFLLDKIQTKKEIPPALVSTLIACLQLFQKSFQTWLGPIIDQMRTRGCAKVSQLSSEEQAILIKYVQILAQYFLLLGNPVVHQVINPQQWLQRQDSASNSSTIHSPTRGMNPAPQMGQTQQIGVVPYGATSPPLQMAQPQQTGIMPYGLPPALGPQYGLPPALGPQYSPLMPPTQMFDWRHPLAPLFYPFLGPSMGWDMEKTIDRELREKIERLQKQVDDRPPTQMGPTYINQNRVISSTEGAKNENISSTEGAKNENISSTEGAKNANISSTKGGKLKNEVEVKNEAKSAVTVEQKPAKEENLSSYIKTLLVGLAAGFTIVQLSKTHTNTTRTQYEESLKRRQNLQLTGEADRRNMWEEANERRRNRWPVSQRSPQGPIEYTYPEGFSEENNYLEGARKTDSDWNQRAKKEFFFRRWLDGFETPEPMTRKYRYGEEPKKNNKQSYTRTPQNNPIVSLLSGTISGHVIASAASVLAAELISIFHGGGGLLQRLIKGKSRKSEAESGTWSENSPNPKRPTKDENGASSSGL